MGQPTAARQLIDEVMNAGKLEAIPRLVHPDFVDWDVEFEAPLTREAFTQFVQGFRQALPDLHFSVLHELVDGEKIALVLRASGTMLGPLEGLAPTGNHAEWLEIHVFIRDPATGLIKEHFGAGHDKARDAQLGLTPPTY